MQPVTYYEIQRLLSDENSAMDAAEAHGALVGSLATTTGYPIEYWLSELLSQGAANPGSPETLQALYENTVQALEGTAMEFEPLQPDEEEPLAARAAALASWCRGFLQGFNATAILDTNNLPEHIGEILRDFNDIIDVDIDSVDDEEEGENAYTELVEFVRVSSQLVFDELRPLRAQGNMSVN